MHGSNCIYFLLHSNELEEVKEKLKQKDEEAKKKVDENEENVWYHSLT